MNMKKYKFILISVFALLFSTTNSIGQNSIPLDGMVLWIRADSVKIENNEIVKLYDLSGMKNDAIKDQLPGITYNMPIIVNNAYNGNPVLRFDGRFTGFTFSNIVDMRTIIVVLKKDSTECLERLPNWKTPARFFLGQDDNITNFHPEHGCYIYNTNLGEVSPNLVNGLTFKNGIPVADGRRTDFPFTLGIVSMIPIGPVKASTVARDRKFLDRSWFGDIAEIIVYNKSLKIEDLQKIHAILAKKYGIINGKI
jgi:hypothetical protein